MNKKAKIIISIMIILIIVLSVVIFFLIKPFGSENKNSDIEKAVGTYHCDKFYGSPATLILKENMTCRYPGNQVLCNWEIKGKNIYITLSVYEITSDNRDEMLYETSVGYSSYSFKSKEECEEQLEVQIKEHPNAINPRCEYVVYDKEPVKARLGENGLTIADFVFYKV